MSDTDSELYKVLTDNMKSPYEGFQYEKGEEYICDDFDDDPENDCSNGFYAVDIDGLIYPWQENGATTVFPVEVGGRSVEIDEFKRRYERLEIVGDPLSKNEILTEAQGYDLPYCLNKVLWPTNPFDLDPPEITKDHIELLKEWDSVGDSVRDLVWDSVRESVYAYIGSCFSDIDKWKYVGYAPGEYTFQPAVDLWEQGLVPSYDGRVWRLHGGEDVDTMWEGSIAND